MRPELLAWVFVHLLGCAVSLAGVAVSLHLGSRPGRQTVPVLRGVISTCALLIHLASIIVGTAVVADLSTGYVWGYAIFQGGLFVVIGMINTVIGRWES